MGRSPVHEVGPSSALVPTLAVAQTSVLRIVCGLGLANAVLLLLVTVAARPTAFAIAVGTGWVGAWGLMARRVGHLRACLERRPWLLVTVAVAGSAPIAVDGVGGTLTTQPVWLTWVAAVTVSASMTLLIAGVMSLGTVAALAFSGLGSRELVAGPDRFQVVLLIGTPLFAAIVGLAVVGVFRAVLAGARDTLSGIAAGAPASTVALGRLLRGEPARLLPSGSAALGEPSARLTETESEIVALLCAGRTPKQIALERGRSIHTVRAQIKHAKRKLEVRTINELIARAWQAT